EGTAGDEKECKTGPLVPFRARNRHTREDDDRSDRRDRLLRDLAPRADADTLAGRRTLIRNAEHQTPGKTPLPMQRGDNRRTMPAAVTALLLPPAVQTRSGGVMKTKFIPSFAWLLLLGGLLLSSPPESAQEPPQAQPRLHADVRDHLAEAALNPRSFLGIERSHSTAGAAAVEPSRP